MADDPIEGLLRLIEDRAENYFSGTEHGHWHITLRPHAHRGSRDSTVYEVVCRHPQSGLRRLILKLHRPANTAANTEHAKRCAQKEYEALSFLHREFARRSLSFSVPSAIDHFPQFAGLLTERCPGERLDQYLRWARIRKSRLGMTQLYDRIGACGEWLALFHSITKTTDSPYRFYAQIENEFRSNLEKCRQLGLEPEIAERAIRAFEAGKEREFKGRHSVVGYHGDFGPYNLFVSDNAIFCVDFEGLNQGVAWSDICYFLGMIQSTGSYHLNRDQIHRATACFLAGYGKHERIDHEESEPFMLAEMLRIMAYTPALRSPEPGLGGSGKKQLLMKRYRNWLLRKLGR